MNVRILSTVREAQIPLLVYSTLSAYGNRRGGELPGPWFVSIFGSIGHRPPAVRQVLYRMVRNREMDVRKRGRVNFYKLSEYGSASIEAGRHMLFGEPEVEWDGYWSLVHFQFESGERVERDLVRNQLCLEGFACLGRGLYIHPRDRIERVRQALEAEGKGDKIVTFRSRRLGGEPDTAFARRLWDIEGLNRRYREFLKVARPLLRRPAAGYKPRDAFMARLAVVLWYLPIAWDDPELPASLLPPGWSGLKAREVAREIYERLWPGTLAYGDSIMTELGFQTGDGS